MKGRCWPASASREQMTKPELYSEPIIAGRHNRRAQHGRRSMSIAAYRRPTRAAVRVAGSSSEGGHRGRRAAGVLHSELLAL